MDNLNLSGIEGDGAETGADHDDGGVLEDIFRGLNLGNIKSDIKTLVLPKVVKMARRGRPLGAIDNRSGAVHHSGTVFTARSHIPIYNDPATTSDQVTHNSHSILSRGSSYLNRNDENSHFINRNFNNIFSNNSNITPIKPSATIDINGINNQNAVEVKKEGETDVAAEAKDGHDGNNNNNDDKNEDVERHVTSNVISSPISHSKHNYSGSDFSPSPVLDRYASHANSNILDINTSYDNELRHLMAKYSTLESQINGNNQNIHEFQRASRKQEEEILLLTHQLQMFRDQLMAKSKYLIEAEDEIEHLSTAQQSLQKQYDNQIANISYNAELRETDLIVKLKDKDFEYNKRIEQLANNTKVYMEEIDKLKLDISEKNNQLKQSSVKIESMAIELERQMTDLSARHPSLAPPPTSNGSLAKDPFRSPAGNGLSGDGSIVASPPADINPSANNNTISNIGGDSSLTSLNSCASGPSYFMYNGSLCIVEEPESKPSKAYYLAILAFLQIIVLIFLVTGFYLYISDFAPCASTVYGPSGLSFIIPNRRRLTS